MDNMRPVVFDTRTHTQIEKNSKNCRFVIHTMFRKKSQLPDPLRLRDIEEKNEL